MAWDKYRGDFNSLTDAQIEQECAEAQERIDQDEEWLEAVAAWKEAGKPRESSERKLNLYHPDTLATIDHEQVVVRSICLADEWNDVYLHQINSDAMVAQVMETPGQQAAVDRIIRHIQRKIEAGWLLPDRDLLNEKEQQT